MFRKSKGKKMSGMETEDGFGAVINVPIPRDVLVATMKRYGVEVPDPAVPNAYLTLKELTERLLNRIDALEEHAAAQDRLLQERLSGGLEAALSGGLLDKLGKAIGVDLSGVQVRHLKPGEADKINDAIGKADSPRKEEEDDSMAGDPVVGWEEEKKDEGKKE